MDVVMIYFYSKRFRFAPSFNYVCFSKSPTFTHFGLLSTFLKVTRLRFISVKSIFYKFTNGVFKLIDL